jgi:predicted dehydrogenase
MGAGATGRFRAVQTVGLVGCGSWGRNILRDLVALGCSVLVVDRSDHGQDNARQYGAAATFRGVEELPEVEGIVVAVQVLEHAHVVERLIPRRVPIFVEKPLTCDPAAAGRIVEAAPDRVFVMDKWRYHPGVERLAALARSGDLGPVVALETVRAGWGNPHRDVDGIWVLTPHDLSIGLEILGHIPSPRAASAEVTTAGVTGLVALLGETPWFRLEVGTRCVPRTRRITLRCRDGLATLVDGSAHHVEVFVGGGIDDTEPAPEKILVSDELPLLRELRAFLLYLQGGPPPRSSAAEGALVVETIARLRQMAGLAR